MFTVPVKNSLTNLTVPFIFYIDGTVSNLSSRNYNKNKLLKA